MSHYHKTPELEASQLRQFVILAEYYFALSKRKRKLILRLIKSLG